MNHIDYLSGRSRGSSQCVSVVARCAVLSCSCWGGSVVEDVGHDTESIAAKGEWGKKVTDKFMLGTPY